MTSINELSSFSAANQDMVLIAQDTSSLQTGKLTIAQLADVFVSIATSGAVTPAAISGAGGVLDDMYSDQTGYIRRIGVQSYTAVTTIPYSDVSGFNIGNLSDVSLPVAVTAGKVLTYDGVSWVPGDPVSGTPVDASSVSAAGAVMTTFFAGASGYMRKLTSSTYDVTTGIPASSITGLGTLAQTSTAASARTFLEFTSAGTEIVVNASTAASVRSYLNLGTLATTSTATSGRSFLGFTTYGATLVSAPDATEARLLLNLGPIAVVSTVTSIYTLMGISPLGRQIVSAGTESSVQSILGYSTVSTLDALSDVSVPAPGTNQVLSYNGTQWTAVSVAGAGAITVSGTATENQYLRYDGANWSGVSVSPLVATSTVTSAQNYLNLGTLATVSTATSGITFLGLGTLATTSTAASARSFIQMTSAGQALTVDASTLVSARTVLGFTSIGTAIVVNSSTAASVRTLLSVPLNVFQDSIGGFIPTVNNQNYVIILNSPVTITVSSLTTRCSSGSATATFKINTTNIGATANAVTSVEQTQAATSANVLVPGDDLIMTISSNSSCKNMAFNAAYTRIL